MDGESKRHKWAAQLETAAHEGVTLSAYACEHRLNVERLYDARRRQRRLGDTNADIAASPFAPVQIKPVVTDAPTNHAKRPTERLVGVSGILICHIGISREEYLIVGIVTRCVD
jgi:hypothetical protein